MKEKIFHFSPFFSTIIQFRPIKQEVFDFYLVS